MEETKQLIRDRLNEQLVPTDANTLADEIIEKIEMKAIPVDVINAMWDITAQGSIITDEFINFIFAYPIEQATADNINKGYEHGQTTEN